MISEFKLTKIQNKKKIFATKLEHDQNGFNFHDLEIRIKTMPI